MKKLPEIECCLECPNSNITTTACMLKGGRSLLPDNVVLNRTIPEWCPLETKLKTLTDEEINYKMQKMFPSEKIMKVIERCGNCHYYQKIANRSGICNLYRVEVFNHRAQDYRLRYHGVMKTDVCERYESEKKEL